MSRATRLLLVVAALGAAAFVWQRQHAPAPPAGGDRGGQRAPVRLASVVEVNWVQRVDLPGRTEADASVVVKSRIDGQVESVTSREGQAVAKGDVLVQLDLADMRARLAQADATLARSRAQAARARAEVKRYQALRDKGFVADERIAELAAAADAASAGERADAAAADLARLQLAHATIRAPFAGVAGAAQVFAGATVKANETPLLTLNRLAPIKVAFNVPEQHLAAIRDRLSSADFAITVTVGRTTLPARVVFVDNAVDAASGTVLVKATLPNKDGLLTAGQFVDVRLPLGTRAGTATVPAPAVQQGAEGSFVFVAKDGKVARRAIEVLGIQDGIAAVTSGLAAGERIVTEGHLRLTDGAGYRDVDATDAPPDGDGARRGAGKS